uniref:Polysaccharide biosynthesis protein C-terminal domain-containing protein n=1 Tax=viral metagenome TaxID=1070528 RepID=A0A6C0KZI0_9ZZZZ|tara:strand:+ start:11056 stop:12402 length:1347 start_codon:yes stop_codon:yes gene_type:complete
MVSLKIPVSFVKNLMKPKPPNSNIVSNKEIFDLTQGTVVNFIMNPLIGAVDTYWISKLNNDAILAGQGTSDRIFNSIFMIASFTPTVIIPIISKYDSIGDNEKVGSVISSSILLIGLIGLFLSSSIFIFKEPVIKSIIPANAPSYNYAIQYLEIRILSLGFALLNSLAFASFRGQRDVYTPLKINLYSQLANMILNPILMRKMGVKGIALGSVISELISFKMFYSSLLKKNLIKFSKIDFKIIKLLLNRGLSIQLRAICLSLIGLIGFRQAQHLDLSGSIAAAHVLNMQLFEIGHIFTYSVGLICPIIIPRYSKPHFVERKLYRFGTSVSILAMISNFVIGKKVFTLFSKNEKVIYFANKVIPASSLFQLICGLTCVTEGMIQGYGMYNIIGYGTVLSTIIFFVATNFSNNLTQIWYTMCLSTAFRGILNTYLMKRIQKDKEQKDKES